MNFAFSKSPPRRAFLLPAASAGEYTAVMHPRSVCLTSLVCTFGCSASDKWPSRLRFRSPFDSCVALWTAFLRYYSASRKLGIAAVAQHPKSGLSHEECIRRFDRWSVRRQHVRRFARWCRAYGQACCVGRFGCQACCFGRLGCQEVRRPPGLRASGLPAPCATMPATAGIVVSDLPLFDLKACVS